MISIQGVKKSLGRFGKGALLILAGVVIGVVGVIGVFIIAVVRHQPEPKDLAAIQLQYTVDYIKSEQTRLGIDCHALRKTLQELLSNDIQPALKNPQPGKTWSRDISQDVRKRMGEMDDNYYACGRLYYAAQSVQWDGFKDLDFAIRLDKEISMLNAFIRFGEFGEECDASCLEKYRELQEAANKVNKELAR